MKEYKIEKSVFKVGEVKFIRVFFDNGEYIPFGSNEIADIAVKLYDRLIVFNNDICPVVESGTIKLNVSKSVSKYYKSAFVSDLNAYKSDRVKYILDRFGQGGISHIMLFNQNCWHKTMHGNIIAEMDGKNLTLKFIPLQGFGSSEGKYNVIKMNDITANIIDNVCIDFENCDSYTVYNNEIIDIDLDLGDKLVYGSHDYGRVIKNGYMIIAFDKSINYRQCNIYTKNNKEHVKVKKLKRRLCKKDIIEAHDICHLYIKYDYAGYGCERTECLDVIQIFDDYELRRQCGLSDSETANDIDYCYFGGYARRLDDGCVLITFGKNAKRIMHEQLNRISQE